MNFFEKLLEIETAREARLKRIEDAIKQLKIGSGSASIEDYKENTFYKRNTLVVDSGTETMYRTTVPEGFTSTTFEADRAAGRLKLVGFESQIVTFNHPPTQAEIDVLPEDTLVAIYSPQDDPYTPALSGDNFEG
jgi:tRNA(Ser,Leu) C12 N-acetylase TAN1